jgi:TRAP-type C4-dicarboxylate transport system substrate-binding protein
MRRKKLAIGLVALVIALVFLVGSSPLEAKTYKLRIQCVYPEGSHGPQLLKEFAKKVEDYTKGDVKVEIFWPGQVIGLTEAYDAVAKGTIEGTYSCLIYYGGIVPEGKTEWLPFNWRTTEESIDIYLKAGYLNLLRKANVPHNVYYLFPMYSATMGCMTKFPVKTLEDFKGRKMRATGLDGPIVKLMGSAAVSLPATELYTTLQRGTVDGVIYPFYTLDTYKLHEVVTTIVLPGLHTPSISGVYLNLDFWKSLTPDLQSAVEKAGLETMLASAKGSDRWDKEALEYAQKHGLKVVTLPDSDVANLKKACASVWDSVAEATPLCKEIVEMYRSYLKGKGAL